MIFGHSYAFEYCSILSAKPVGSASQLAFYTVFNSAFQDLVTNFFWLLCVKRLGELESRSEI